MTDTRLLQAVAAVALLRMLMACTSVSPAPASWAPGSPSVPQARRSGPQAPPCEPGNPRRLPGHPCGTAAGRRRRSPAWWQVRRGVATSAGRGRCSMVDWRPDASVVQSHQQQQLQQLQGCTTGPQERWNTSVINTPHCSHSLGYEKIPGLSRTPEAIFQDPVVSQQCLNIETNTRYLFIDSLVTGDVSEYYSSRAVDTSSSALQSTIYTVLAASILEYME